VEAISTEGLTMSKADETLTNVPGVPALPELAPPDYCDPVIEAYKKDVDRTLLRENLKLAVEERIRKAERFHKSVESWREAGRKSRAAGPTKADGT
jgi:hypothetical protein